MMNEQTQRSLRERLRPLLFMAFLSILLLLSQKNQTIYAMLERGLYDNFFAPMRTMIYAPLRALERYSQESQQRGSLEEQLQELKQINTSLQAQMLKMAHLRAENNRLKILMDSTAEKTEPVLIAEIRDTAIDGYSEVVTINRGQRQGVFMNQAVIDSFGLVGQVIKVFGEEAQVMLISDSRSRVPVYVARTQQRALVAGGGDYGNLLLTGLRLDSDIQLGDMLITSGMGGVFPRGYPVAKVVQVERDQRSSFLRVRLQPLAKLNSMLEVLLLANAPEAELLISGPNRPTASPNPTGVPDGS